MKSIIFEQDRRIMNAIRDPATVSLDSMFDEIDFIGRPKVFGTHREYLKIKVKIEKIELCQIILPQVPIDERDTNGICKLDGTCDNRTFAGCCTSFEPDCKYRDTGTS
jgi:hypothetical protein